MDSDYKKKGLMAEKDKRKLERFFLVLPTCLSMVDDEGKERTYELFTSNISSGGAYFETTHALPVGTEVMLDIVVPGKKDILKGKRARIKVAGKVLRSSEKDMAVCLSEKFLISSFKSSFSYEKD